MNKHIQGTTAWLEERRNHIGASDAVVIVGDSPWKTPLELWEQKLSLRPDDPENQYMRRGTEMEPLARKVFEEMTGYEVFPQVVYHKKHKFMMASLDGLSLDGTIAVEIKCPGEKDHALAVAGKIPSHYKAQLQHQMACLDIPMIYYFSFDGENGFIIEVQRDDKYIEEMIEKERQFQNCIDIFVQPEFTDRDYKEMEWHIEGSELKEIDAEIKRLTERKNTIKEKCIQEAAGRSCRGGGIILYRSFPRGRINYTAIPELQEMDLERYRSKPKETWTLRISK